MYLLMIDTRKKLGDFLESLTPSDKKEIFFINISDDIKKKNNFDKKCLVINAQSLLPSPDIITEYIATGDEEVYSIKYLQYLQNVTNRYTLGKIMQIFLLEKNNTILCFGDIEKELLIPKILVEALENLYPGVKIFKYKEYKNTPFKLENYKPSNDLLAAAEKEVRYSRKLYDNSLSCKDPFDSAVFYSE